MKQEETADLVVIGGGASGFFCAVNAAKLQPNFKIMLLEKSGKLLQKVKVSGGGRCNVTHHLFETAAFSRKYPRGEKFLKKSLHHFGPRDTISWFEKRGVVLKEEADGRMFPVTNSSQTIIDCLLTEAEQWGVEIRMHQWVTALKPHDGQWKITTAEGKVIIAKNVCIACGGFARAEQYDWIVCHTRHSFALPVPSLFTFNTPGHSITSLMGVAVHARVKIAGTKIESEGPVLITHWGLSGPAVLRCSAFGARLLAEKAYAFTVMVNWLPAFNENTLREKILQYRNEKGAKKVMNTEWINLPERLMLYLMGESGIHPDQRWADLPAAPQNKLVKALTAFELQAKGKTTFKEEFVTAGGIELSEIDPETMESRLHPGLFFAGEIMDADGITGGFNFQHAWTSGMLAARKIAGHIP